MLPSSIAGRIGRGNLNRSAGLTSADRESANVGSSFLSAGASADVGLGRLTAGTGGLIVIGLVLFYVWTRQHQA